MQLEITVPDNDNATAKTRLVSMYGDVKVAHRAIGRQRAYLTILRWLASSEYQPLVKLELIDNELTFSYIRSELWLLEPKLGSIERGFKHLKPYKMYVSWITRGAQLWKQWKFKRAPLIKVQTQQAPKRQRPRDGTFNLSKYQRKNEGIAEDQDVDDEQENDDDGTDSSQLDKQEEIIPPAFKRPHIALNLTDYDVSQVIFDAGSVNLTVNWDFDSLDCGPTALKGPY
jgi:hypothetical protein